MYLGNQPALSYTSFAKQDFTTSATTSYTLDQPVANENEIALFINFVRQEPTTAYTASGTSLTLTSATSASDDMYCVFLGKAVQTVNPPNGSVGTSQLANSAVSTVKIADDAVTKDKTSNLMYPAFHAFLNADQTITSAVMTKAQFNNESFDTDNCYDNSTNYRFTPNVSGKYFIYAQIVFNVAGGSEFQYAYSNIKKNGTDIARGNIDFRNGTGGYANSIILNIITDANGSTDYFEVHGELADTITGSAPRFIGNSTRSDTYFGAYRIGD